MKQKTFLYERSQHIRVIKVPSLVQTALPFLSERGSLRTRQLLTLQFETHALYYNYFLQTTAISHSKLGLTTKATLPF